MPSHVLHLRIGCGQRISPASVGQASGVCLGDCYANLETYVNDLIQKRHTVYLVLSPPTDDRFNPRRMISRSWTGLRIDPDLRAGVSVADLKAATAATDRRLIAIADRTGATTIDPFVDICGDGSTCSLFFADGEPKFADALHLRSVFVKDNIKSFDDLLVQ